MSPRQYDLVRRVYWSEGKVYIASFRDHDVPYHMIQAAIKKLLAVGLAEYNL